MSDLVWLPNTDRLFDREAQNRQGRLWVADRDTIVVAIGGLKWLPIPADGTIRLPFTPGELLKAAVRQLELAHVTQVAANGAIPAADDYSTGLISLVGIRCQSDPATRSLYIVDEGCEWFVAAYRDERA